MFGHTPRSHMHSRRRISLRCAHTLWCDMNPPWRFCMRRYQTCRVAWVQTALVYINLLFLSYHFRCTCVSFGRVLAMLSISPGDAGRGRNLEHTSSQDPTRCWSCSPIEHEILSAGRWFIILVLLQGDNGERERERNTEKGGNAYLVFLLCQQIPEWFPNVDYFSFCDCSNTKGRKNQRWRELDI